MRILVIGGSYFLGRVFTMLASKENHSITMVNRGSYSMESFGVKEYHFDRHDAAAWQVLPWQEYDAVVDFCAYHKGEIRIVAENLPGTIAQYILISTCDVYERQTGMVKTENTPFSSIHYEGEAGEYIFQKIQLERELEELGNTYGFGCTFMRPGMIYGPYNYAPRESVYIQMIAQHMPVPRIINASGKFQFVYVTDVAEGILAACGNLKAYNQAYNICGPEVLDYVRFYDLLELAAGEEIAHFDTTVEEAEQKGYPLPFPVYSWESEFLDGTKICRELDITYTPAEEGIAKTYRALLPVYR